SFLDPLQAHDNTIPVHRFVEHRAGDVDVSSNVERTLRGDESVARWVRLQPAHVEVHLLGQAESLPPNLDEIAGLNEPPQMTFERGAFFTRDLQELKQLSGAGGMMHVLAHQREKVFAGNHPKLPNIPEGRPRSYRSDLSAPDRRARRKMNTSRC